MLIAPEALSLIDSVAGNRTEFMVEAALVEARKRRRELEDAEIARICREQAKEDRALAGHFDGTLTDGLETTFSDPYGESK
jgi:hypothetical protein